jgi:hypothetical protein
VHGDRVDDGLVSVHAGDRLLGALAPHDGRARIPLAPFEEPGTVTLTVRYTGGSTSEAAEEVTVEVTPAKR